MELPLTWKTKDGAYLTLRRLEESDSDLLLAFVANLSTSARYFRFGQGDFAPRPDECRQFCRLSPEMGTHLIVLAPGDAGEQVVGSARYVILSDRPSCEFVIVVADQWRHHGIGCKLMEGLIGYAKNQGLKKMYGLVLGSNLDMLHFIADQGFEISDSPEGDWMKIATINL